MTPTLLTFCDINNHLRYVNLNNIEVIKFSTPSNIMMEKMIVRYLSGEALTYEVREDTATSIKKKLNQFGL